MPSAAALLGPGPQLYIQSLPKEAGAIPTYATAGVWVRLDGRLTPAQPFPPAPTATQAAAAAAAATAKAARQPPESGGHLLQVSRYVRALHARRYPRPAAPLAAAGLPGQPANAGAAAEARELEDLVGYKAVSASLGVGGAGWSDDEVQAWERGAAAAGQALPGWVVRLHYNSSAGGCCGRLGRLRELGNVELVDMASASVAAAAWFLAPALEGAVAAAVFVSGPPGAAAAAVASLCWLELVAGWQAGGATGLAAVGGGAGGCGSEGGREGDRQGGARMWGARGAGLAAVRAGVLRAMAERGGGAGPGLEEGLTRILDTAMR